MRNAHGLLSAAEAIFSMATVTVQREKVEEEAVQRQKFCVILSKATLDMVYPAFMMANTAAAMGSEAHIFFTFWGLQGGSRPSESDFRFCHLRDPAVRPEPFDCEVRHEEGIRAHVLVGPLGQVGVDDGRILWRYEPQGRQE